MRFAQGEGYLQVGDNRALMLVEEAHPARTSSTPRDLRERLDEGRGAPWRRPRTAPRRSAAAQRDKRRWETFLEIAEGG